MNFALLAAITVVPILLIERGSCMPSTTAPMFERQNLRNLSWTRFPAPGVKMSSISVTGRSSGSMHGSSFFVQDDTNRQRRKDREDNLRMANNLRRQADDQSGAERDALLQKAQTFFQKVCVCVYVYHGASVGVPPLRESLQLQHVCRLWLSLQAARHRIPR